MTSETPSPVVGVPTSHRGFAGVLLIVKPNQSVVLQVVIDGQDGNDRDWFVRHRRQQDDPVHRNRRREKKVFRHIQRQTNDSALYLPTKPDHSYNDRACQQKHSQTVYATLQHLEARAP